MPADSTINLHEVVGQFYQDCECKLPDPDDCLLLISMMDVITGGVPICSICGEAYSYDETGLILIQSPDCPVRSF